MPTRQATKERNNAIFREYKELGFKKVNRRAELLAEKYDLDRCTIYRIIKSFKL